MTVIFVIRRRGSLAQDRTHLCDRHINHHNCNHQTRYQSLQRRPDQIRNAVPLLNPLIPSPLKRPLHHLPSHLRPNSGIATSTSLESITKSLKPGSLLLLGRLRNGVGDEDKILFMRSYPYHLVLSLLIIPIYHDYHGDSKSSSISTWDQIQLSLKILLPSYEAILCDSPVVSSFLSDQNCPEFQQTCDSINATLRKLIQEEEKNYFPEFQAQIQQNSVQCSDSTIHQSNPEIKKSDQAESEPEFQEHESEAEIDIEDAAPIRFATKFTDPDQEATWNSENSAQLTENNTTIQANYNSKFQIATEITNSVITQNTSPEFTTRTTPQLYSTKQKQSQFQSQEDDESDEQSIYLGCDDRRTRVVVQRPPPESPDLTLLAEGEGDLASAVVAAEVRSCRPDDLRNAVTGTHCGAEDGTVTKGKWTDAIATATNGGLKARQLRRFFLLTPPPLLAAVLPWNRGCEREEWSRNAGKWSEEAWRRENALGVGASGSRMEATRVAENGEAARQRTLKLAVVRDALEREFCSLHHFG
ncbi:hypothetical protein PIB30_021507 [Stylosanthes scabra]|uniref:Uncharacterized protein n=1 Tax=Stylosanthes scabra TaxID=79078 RepID=A0ABU6Q8M4_9FABA|nr:hypothetical protein [Stylosanthes scabra]